MGARRLAREAGIPVEQLKAVLRGKARIDAQMAICLSEYFCLRERFWLGLQMDYDIEEAYRQRDACRRQHRLPTEPSSSATVELSTDPGQVCG
jgi:addiction module HigA family antidote